VTQLAAGLALWTAGFRSSLQYRTDTFIVIAMALAFQGTGFAFVWVLLSRFESLAGWTLGQVAFLYGLRLIVHALAGVLTGPIFSLESQVRSGEFDRYLLRPISPLVQFMTQRVEISILGDLLGGVAVFVVANQTLGLAWSPSAVVYLGLAILGGALVEGSVRILIGAATFRTLSSQSLLFLTDSVFSNFANYPLSIFGTILQNVFTFILPLAFVAYLPATALLQRTAELQVSPAFAYAAPIVGLAWAFVAARVFNHELAQYQSAGH
jgi:viologen exporter family transport system permease protein